MEFDPSDPVPSADELFRDFGRACRDERDRVQLASLAAEDRRFESGFERAVAEAFVARLIATIVR